MKIICSSVIRSSLNNDHGAVYILNLDNNKYIQKLKTNKKINFEGRGGERGFRGIKLYKENILIVSHNEIYIFDKNLNQIEILTAPEFSSSIHEISIHKDILYVTSTGYDSILLFDLIQKRFIKGYRINHFFKLKEFDYTSKYKPDLSDKMHINNVFVNDCGVFFSGTQFENIIKYLNGVSEVYGKTVYGTHNCQPYGKDIICNNTLNDKISVFTRNGKEKDVYLLHKVKKYKLENYNVGDKIAKQPFARGLLITDGEIIGGSSPGMISVYDKKTHVEKNRVLLSNDITNCIHGISEYPYECKEVE